MGLSPGGQMGTRAIIQKWLLDYFLETNHVQLANDPFVKQQFW